MDDDDKRQTSPAFSDSDVGHLWPGTMHNANEDVTHIFRADSICLRGTKYPKNIQKRYHIPAKGTCS